jgi:flavin-dependent dehydrogenase
MILDKARENGASVMECTKANKLLKSNNRVVGIRAESEDFGQIEINAPIVVDASGRDCFAARKENWMVRDPELKKVALWTYFKDAKRDPGLDEGATTVAYLPNKGWFWYIPLSDGMVSVGIVAERDYLFNGTTKDHAVIFNREIHNNEWIKEHLSDAKQIGEYRITGEYSYRNRYCASDGLVLAGDALGFLDPVFSSGVFLALKSGVMLADEIDLALKAEDFTAKSFHEYGKMMQSSIETMRKIVYAFYDQNFSFGDLAKRGEHLRAALTDCLIGNVDDNEFRELFDAMSDLADLPEEIKHGLTTASS